MYTWNSTCYYERRGEQEYFLDILEMERRCIFVMTDGYVMQLVFASANVFE